MNPKLCIVRNNVPKVVVGMSGGVDSSVAAALLKEGGYDVAGVTLRLWHAGDDRGRPGGCCSMDDIADARRVCHHLGIRHYVLDFGSRFEETVVADFVREYLRGHTPNPCIVCNQFIKFGLLMEKAQAMGFDLMATGHYARIEKRGETSVLAKAKDALKDQSYVLYRLTSGQLERLIFPLGEYTKAEVRDIARRLALPAAEKPESQEICFVPDDYASFLRAYLPDFDRKVRPGAIVDVNGAIVGKHKGLAFYTIGQRKGLGLSSPEPLYVIALDPAKNEVVVGGKEKVYSSKMPVETLSWAEGKTPELPLKCMVKIRRMHKEASALISPAGAGVLVEFDKPQMAITAGQSAVFYENNHVLGGGIISDKHTGKA
ncbi:MAG: tRNA 2-thiouridine(34) synthase MnmA [Elusimicrobia bacterium RIFOXYA2_FULL_50_26]|nr:MAG: tRNA 2-thiouridine(34) synthase MnmA [Elusimicrobia bacterium RIFOXYA2_FULL_50_26]OGS25395.1 MAG: tRNA 2-thiouridine(34) synthase MnmA [Elusimicrobia bacterium RIFOXYB2_FULL_50_12]